MLYVFPICHRQYCLFPFKMRKVCSVKDSIPIYATLQAMLLETVNSIYLKCLGRSRKYLIMRKFVLIPELIISQSYDKD